MNFLFDTEKAKTYHSASQAARVLTEDWVVRNMYCPVCGNVRLTHCANNAPAADFFCTNCGHIFELKSKRKATDTLDSTVADGAYDTFIQRIQSNSSPNFLVMTYHQNMVRNLLLIPNHFFVPSIVIKRPPLAATARRAGWVGCNINMSAIPNDGKIFIIRGGVEEEREKVFQQYQRTKFLASSSLHSRGWLMDTLLCIEQISSNPFSLADMYTFEPQLAAKHPDNHFVRAKIRQQLQLLRNAGILEFTTRGMYKRIAP